MHGVREYASTRACGGVCWGPGEGVHTRTPHLSSSTVAPSLLRRQPGELRPGCRQTHAKLLTCLGLGFPWGKRKAVFVLQLLKAACPRAHAPHPEKTRPGGARAPQPESSPLSLQLEKARTKQRRPSAAINR